MNDTSYANDYATGIEGVDIDALQDRADTFTLGIYAETGLAFDIQIVRDGYDYYCEVSKEGHASPWPDERRFPSLAEVIDYIEKVTA